MKIESVSKKYFRYLKESLKDASKELYCNMYKDINLLIRTYGDFSNKLYEKDIEIKY
ncbi:hypothetical protein AB2Z22_002993 [Clostridium botulinum]